MLRSLEGESRRALAARRSAEEGAEMQRGVLEGSGNFPT